MELLTLVAGALSATLLGNVVFDVIRRLVKARETTSIELKIGDTVVKLNAANSEDAEALIKAYLSRAQATSGVDAGKREVEE